MKKLIILFMALFLFTTKTESQRLYIYGAERVDTLHLFYNFVRVGRYVFGVGGIFGVNGAGVYVSSIDSLSKWTKAPNVGVLGEGDFIATTKGYIVVSSGIGTYLSPDTGRTWYANREYAPFAMLPLSDGSFLAGGMYKLFRVRGDVSPNIVDENLWQKILDSTTIGRNTPRFLYRTSTGRILMYVLGLDHTKEGIWISDDDAKSWRRPHPNLDGRLGTLFRSMAEYNHILIGRAEDGTFVSYNDGETWNKILGPVFYTSTGQRLFIDSYTNVFASPSIGYLTGGEKMLWSWDLSNWEVLFPDSADISDVYGIVEIQPDKILVSASGGLYLLKMTALNPVEEKEITTSFSLSQNYPNPFNPTTTIRFSLPKSSKVKLIVFDVLGKEIATLVNGELDQGEHSVVFNAQNLPSGVYLYKLTAGDFVQTRKMLLL
ncbi:T9SS type A sorting domain-containing protein, partial [Melioribacteraceae bacterium 4301-Me]|uniref:T9SS type A sorting domain-containing protein n=1 Tax=Pyranulibacter aquaticus TaxID=3163344 RepID=UPI003597A9FD